MKTIALHPSLDGIISRQGGFPRGHMVELYGPNGGGKTTLAILLVASAQQQGLKVGYFEAEYLDKEHAEFFGVNLEALDLVKTKSAEEIFKRAIEMCNEGYGLIIIDSLAGMLTDIQAETEVGDSNQFAPIARFCATELGKLDDAVATNDTCIVFTNQIRSVVKTFGMGPDTDSFGGFKFKHTVGARFEVRRVSWIKYSDKVIGFKIKVRAPIKNRFAPPNREAYADIIFDHDAPPLAKINSKKKTKIDPITFKEEHELIKLTEKLEDRNEN